MIGEVIARIDAERMGGVSREMQAAHYLAMRSHAGALLALLRETRAALQPFTLVEFADIATHLPAGKWFGNAPTIGDVRRAQAVLRQVVE